MAINYITWKIQFVVNVSACLAKKELQKIFYKSLTKNKASFCSHLIVKDLRKTVFERIPSKARSPA